MQAAEEVGNSIKGSLRATPFAHLLLDIMSAERCGTLLIHDDAGAVDARIRFEGGVPTGVHSSTPAQNLVHTLIPLCARTHGGFVVLEGSNELGYGDGVVVGRADPLAVIAAAMRGPTREDAIDQVLASHGQHALQLEQDADLERYPLSAQERSVVDRLVRNPTSLAQLQAQSELPERIVRRVVYQLSISGALAPAPAQREPTATTVEVPRLPLPPPVPRFSQPVMVKGSGRAGVFGKASATLLEHGSTSGVLVRVAPASVQAQPGVVSGRYHVQEPEHGTFVSTPEHPSERPSALPAALALWRKDILERRRCIELQNYFEVLGVADTASDDEIDRAFHELHDRMQPDLLPDALASMRDAAEAVVHHLILAHETLLDPVRRAAYARRMHSGAAAPSAPPRQKRVASAQTHRAKAEALLRRNDYAGALHEADRAFRFEHSARNEAFYGWLLYLRHSAGGRVHPSAKKHLQRALQRDPECEQAHFYTACLLKQSGHEEQAYAHFRRALKANPDNQEAQRETRLYESRRKRDQPGLFQRLLQREQAKKGSVGCARAFEPRQLARRDEPPHEGLTLHRTGRMTVP